MKFCVQLCFIFTLIIGFISSILPFNSLAADGDAVTPQSWSAFQDPDFGASIYYPSDMFVPGPSIGGAYIFSSPDGKATLMLKAFLDPLRAGASETVVKLKSGKGGHRIGEIKSGATWFEMSGMSGADNLVFLRVIYSCKEQVVSQFNLIYPKAMKDRYEQILPKMKKRFHAGIGSKTPVRECS